MKATELIIMLTKTIVEYGDRELVNGDLVVAGINFDAKGDTYELNLESKEYVENENED